MLTGGGDCAGLNAAIRAVVRTAGHELSRSVVGYRRGWNGVLDGDSIELDPDAVRGTLPRGGTMLGTSRSSRRLQTEGPAPLIAQLERDVQFDLSGGSSVSDFALRRHLNRPEPVTLVVEE